MLRLHLIEGGLWWMLPIYILWLTVIVLTALLIVRYLKTGEDSKRIREVILFLGSFAFLYGMLGQALGIMQMMNCVGEVGNIAPAIIAKGFVISMLPTMYGFVLMLVSFIVWFVAKRISAK
ncbi:MAG TPA: MotA/TolQ/ExbB proton channel family protein [Tenuifilaceae bacterium]|nr:MotA/TolQ/ExbB proton channel family protein [Tenuifilaceae bacterium]